MGYMFGGIIIKNGASMSNEEVLQMLNREGYYYNDDISLEKATGGSFDGIAIARAGDMALIFGGEIAYSCSFEENKLSATDGKLEPLSKEGDILCFIVNSVSDTYAWSIFSKGKRIRAKAVAGQKILSGFGEPAAYEKGMTLNDQGMIRLIENFTGYSFIELVFEKNLFAAAYGP